MTLIAVVTGTVLGAAGVAMDNWFVWAFLAPLSYLAGIKLVSLRALKTEKFSVVMRLPFVLITMHMNWGWGFLTSPAIRDL